MLDRICLEPEPADYDRFSRWYPTPFADGPAVKALQCFLCCVDRARRTVGQPLGMVRMRMGKHDGARGDRRKLSQPVRPAIDHHLRTFVPDEQRAVTLAQASADSDLAARTKKNQLHHPSCHWHLDP